MDHCPLTWGCDGTRERQQWAGNKHLKSPLKETGSQCGDVKALPPTCCFSLLPYEAHVYSVCVCVGSGSLCILLGWSSGASGATQSEWPLYRCYYTDEAAHLIVNPSVRNHTNLCVCVCVFVPISPSFLTLFLLLYFIWRHWFDSQNHLLKVSSCRTLILLWCFWPWMEKTRKNKNKNRL